MAKKFVRGITDIKTINNQDFDTNNVNDLLSDGEHNYIHRKKGKIEEYHNLTNNLKTVTSDNTDLLTVTNDNDNTNSAKLHPKHDTQKEQTIESTRNTITITHGENGTSGTTKVDTNPAKVMEHDNLLTDYGIIKTKSGNTTKLGVDYTKVNDGFDLNTLVNGRVKSGKFINSPKNNNWFLVSSFGEAGYTVQRATTLVDNQNTVYVRTKQGDSASWGEWRLQVGDKSTVDALLVQKQNTISNSASIGVLTNNTLRQLYLSPSTYSHAGGLLKTHYKSLSKDTNVSTPELEFNFIVKINKGATTANFTLNTNDATNFNNIITSYGRDNAVRINALIFELSGSSLTVTLANTVNHDYVITFTDII